MTQKNGDTERFLQQATRGLTRRKRAEAQAELRSHLHERTQQLILEGKLLPSAQAQAMQELGAPAAIARGLRRNEQVHPLLSVLALAGLAGLMLWPAAELRGQSLINRQENIAYQATGKRLLSDGYLTMPQVRRQLEPLGIGLQQRGDVYWLTSPGLTDAALSQNGHFWCLPPVTSSEDRPSLPELLSGKLTEYVAPDSLVTCMAQAGWPLEASPAGLSLRGHSLPLKAEPVNAYLPALTRALAGLTAPAWTGFDATSPVVFPVAGQAIRGKGGTQNIQVAVKGPVLLLERRINPTQPRLVFAAALYWPDAAGTVKLPDTVRLYTSQMDWLAAPAEQKAGLLLPVSTQTTDPIKLSSLPFTALQ